MEFIIYCVQLTRLWLCINIALKNKNYAFQYLKKKQFCTIRHLLNPFLQKQVKPFDIFQTILKVCETKK